MLKFITKTAVKAILRYFEKRAGDSTEFRIKALSFYTDLIDDAKLSNALNNIDVTKTMVTQYTSVVDLYKKLVRIRQELQDKKSISTVYASHGKKAIPVIKFYTTDSGFYIKPEKHINEIKKEVLMILKLAKAIENSKENQDIHNWYLLSYLIADIGDIFVDMIKICNDI